MTRVLVVDDVQDVREVIAEALAEGGYEVAEAASGVEALRVVAEAPPDVVLLDIGMPKMNGFEVLRTLRRQGPTRRLPVIMLTAMADEWHRREADILGAQGYLVKGTFDLDEMVRAVAMHV